MDRKEKIAELGRRDPIGVFDPLLAAVSPKGEYPFYRAGYMLWPHPRAAEAAALRLMSIGNSTSLWPDAAWSQALAGRLQAEGLDIGLWHGAGKGNTSSQELLRVVRDAPAIRPDLIVSLSGICDIGHLLNSRGYPFAHKYTRRVLDFAQAHDLADEITYGYPDPVSPAQSWCRNQRMARVLAEDMGIPYIVFLQPVQGYGTYDMSPEEEAFFAEKAGVILKAIDKPYGQCVTEFYDEVRAIIAADPARHDHVIDFTEVFADCPGAYRDHRHQSAAGVAHLAARMLPLILRVLSARGGASDARGGTGER